LYFGEPFVGIFQQYLSVKMPYRFLGFEAFNYVWYWRLFLEWFKSKLRYLNNPWIMELSEQRLFLGELQRRIEVVFSPKHFLYSDEQIQDQVTSRLSKALGLRGRRRDDICELGRCAFASVFSGSDEPLPALKWKRVAFQPAPPSVARFEITAPGFLDFRSPAAGEEFAANVHRLGSRVDRQALLEALK
jgi:hypothetical protein